MDQIDEVVKMLDSMTQSGVSRIKVETSQEVEAGKTKKDYHHGRCDVGSPFATGKLFDLEEEKDPLAEAMRKTVEKDLYMQFLGIEVLELREGYALARMRYKKELANPYGMFHGGSLYSMADIVAGLSACMSGHYVTTVSGNLNFLLPAKETEYVFCEAVLLRQGKHLIVFEVKLKDEGGRLLDSGEFTYFILGQRVPADGT